MKILLVLFFINLMAVPVWAYKCQDLFGPRANLEALLLNSNNIERATLNGNRNLTPRHFHRLYELTSSYKAQIKQERKKELVDIIIDHWLGLGSQSDARISRFVFLKEVAIGNQKRREEYFLESFLGPFEWALVRRHGQENFKKDLQFTKKFLKNLIARY